MNGREVPFQKCNKKAILKKTATFTAKHLHQVPQKVKLQAFPRNFTKKGLNGRCFLLTFAKFYRTSFLKLNSGQLLLKTIFCILITSWDKVAKVYNIEDITNQTNNMFKVVSTCSPDKNLRGSFLRKWQAGSSSFREKAPS